MNKYSIPADERQFTLGGEGNMLCMQTAILKTYFPAIQNSKIERSSPLREGILKCCTLSGIDTFFGILITTSTDERFFLYLYTPDNQDAKNQRDNSHNADD